jgi:hypothetical protein
MVNGLKLDAKEAAENCGGGEVGGWSCEELDAEGVRRPAVECRGM